MVANMLPGRKLIGRIDLNIAVFDSVWVPPCHPPPFRIVMKQRNVMCYDSSHVELRAEKPKQNVKIEAIEWFKLDQCGIVIGCGLNMAK